MKSKWKSLVVCLAVPLAVGAAAAFLTRDGMRGFESLVQPPLSPPAWLFPVVWTLLYLMMGLASWLVLVSGGEKGRAALDRYAIQLGANFIWPLLFFGRGLYLAAFFWILLLWCLILVNIAEFGRVSRAASRLMLPYLVWVSFAAYLNFGVQLLN